MVKNENDKKLISGYLICNGEIQFTNYLNKVIRTIKIKEILERWRDEIERMSHPNKI